MMKTNEQKLMAKIKVADVEWKTLGEIAIIKTGQAISKEKINNNLGIYPVINSGREPLGYIDEWNTEDDPIGITTRGAGVGPIIWQEGKYFRGNLNYSVTIKNASKINVRFLYHLLLEFQSDIHNLCTFTGIPALNASELKKLELPIPPLSVQAEIVRVLDAMTSLTAELSIREKQYNYYRNKLLNFANQERGAIYWLPLGEVATIQRGASPRPIAKYITDDNDGVAWIKIGDVSSNSKYITQTAQKITHEGAEKSRVLKKGDFIISNSMSFGRPYILAIDGAIHDGWTSISNFQKYLNADFLYHYLSSNIVQDYWSMKINSATVRVT